MNIPIQIDVISIALPTTRRMRPWKKYQYPWIYSGMHDDGM